VKLLFDQNLSPRLVNRLADIFPMSSRVQSLGLDTAPDGTLWTYARDHGYALVTKDEDFNALSVVHGFPPKVIWLQIGNCTTDEVEEILRVKHAEIYHFDADATVGTFVLR
jgi:predicted nuclease of predicted toxin-antitoxin system